MYVLSCCLGVEATSDPHVLPFIGWCLLVIIVVFLPWFPKRRVLVRLAIYRTSHARILTNGGSTAFDSGHGTSRYGPTPRATASHSSSGFVDSGKVYSSMDDEETRIRQVYDAFLAFREKHGILASQLARSEGVHESIQAIRNQEMYITGTALQQHSVVRRSDGSAADGIRAFAGKDSEDSVSEIDRQSKSSPAEPSLETYWWSQPSYRTSYSTNNVSGVFNDSGARSEKIQKMTEDLTMPPGRASGLEHLEKQAAAAQSLAIRLIVAGEILHILRPLMYSVALRTWGRRSWKPYCVSLVTEAAAGRMTAAGINTSRKAAASAAANPAVTGTILSRLYELQGLTWRRDEADELTRRKLLLVFYLLRDPFFSR